MRISSALILIALMVTGAQANPGSLRVCTSADLKMGPGNGCPLLLHEEDLTSVICLPTGELCRMRQWTMLCRAEEEAWKVGRDGICHIEDRP